MVHPLSRGRRGHCGKPGVCRTLGESASHSLLRHRREVQPRLLRFGCQIVREVDVQSSHNTHYTHSERGARRRRAVPAARPVVGPAPPGLPMAAMGRVVREAWSSSTRSGWSASCQAVNLQPPPNGRTATPSDPAILTAGLPASFPLTRTLLATCGEVIRGTCPAGANGGVAMWASGQQLPLGDAPGRDILHVSQEVIRCRYLFG